MPNYDLALVKELIAADAWAYATPGCRSHVTGLDLDRCAVGEILMLLEPHDFSKVFGQLCATDFGDIVGDAYVLWCDLDSASRTAKGHGDKMYIKLAVDTDEELGDACLVISFHRSRP